MRRIKNKLVEWIVFEVNEVLSSNTQTHIVKVKKKDFPDYQHFCEWVFREFYKYNEFYDAEYYAENDIEFIHEYKTISEEEGMQELEELYRSVKIIALKGSKYDFFSEKKIIQFLKRVNVPFYQDTLVTITNLEYILIYTEGIG